jgi:hypothetical protein
MNEPNPHWLAITLVIFTDGTVYGRVEKRGTEKEIDAYLKDETKKITGILVPHWLRDKEIMDYVIYGVQHDASCTDLRVTGPSPDLNN